MEKQIKELFDSGLSQRKIAKELDIAEHKVQYAIEKNNWKREKVEPISKETLSSLLLNEKLSKSQIAKQFNVSPSVVTRLVKKYSIVTNVKPQTKRDFKIEKSELRSMFIDKNMTMVEVASFFGCSVGTIEKRLREFGIKKDRVEVAKRTMGTQIELYGGTGFGSKAISKASKETMLKKYGYETPFESKRWQDETKQLMKEKYSEEELREILSRGVRGRTDEQKEEITKKYIQTSVHRYGVKSPKQRHLKIVLETKEDLLSVLRIIGDRPTISEISEYTGYSESHISKIIGDHPSCREKIAFRESSYELKVATFLDRYGIEYIRNTRKVITPKELDFFIPSLNLGLEVNDNWTHNSTKEKPFSKEKNYHLEKSNLCMEKGIRLIHIFEWELNNLEKVLSAVLPKKRIAARKTTFSKIDFKQAKTFLEENHRQGSGSPASQNFGLFYEGELVQIINFRSSRNNARAKVELYRLASKSDVVVIGGASKLFSNALKSIDGPIISYCDLAHNSGNIYSQLGFNLSHISSPNYKWVKGETVLSREQTQKHKLVEQGYPKEKTEKEIMESIGFLQMFDCGNQVWYYNK